MSELGLKNYTRSLIRSRLVSRNTVFLSIRLPFLSLMIGLIGIVSGCVQKTDADEFREISKSFGLSSCEITNRIYENQNAPILLLANLDGPYERDSTVSFGKPTFREIRLEDIHVVSNQSRKRLHAGYFVTCGRTHMISAPEESNPYAFDFCPAQLKPGPVQYEIEEQSSSDAKSLIDSNLYDENGIFVWPKARLDLKEAGELMKKRLVVEKMLERMSTDRELAEQELLQGVRFKLYLIKDARKIEVRVDSANEGDKVRETASVWSEGIQWANFEKIRLNRDSCYAGLDEAVRAKRRRCADDGICPEKLEETY